MNRLLQKVLINGGVALNELQDFSQYFVLLEILSNLICVQEPKESFKIVTKCDCNLRLVVVILVYLGMLLVELLCKAFMRVCLNTQRHVYSEKLKQECHLIAELGIDFREVINVSLAEEPFWFMLEEST